MINKGVEIVVGGKYRSYRHGFFRILKYVNSKSVLIKFEDTGYETWVTSDRIRRGTIRDFLDTSPILSFGVGITDILVTTEMQYHHKLWKNMLKRCFNEKHLEVCPTYKDCSVDNKFFKFSNFYSYVITLYGCGLRDDKGKRYCLDKDLLSGNFKSYREGNICFVPQEINKFLCNRSRFRGEHPVGVSYCKDRDKFEAKVSVNGKVRNFGRFDTPEEAFQAYKQAKTSLAKNLAEKWKGKIDDRVYFSLLNYIVEEKD